jgi:hypothetical protein
LNSRRKAENLTAKSVEGHAKLRRAGFTAETQVVRKNPFSRKSAVASN